MQALFSQRNIAANAQRKYVVSYTVIKQDRALMVVPGSPVELKDVLLYAPSPSGVSFAHAAHALLTLMLCAP